MRQAALPTHRDGARVFAATHSTGPGTLDFAEAPAQASCATSDSATRARPGS
ncbi:TetR/AcrR family transcriptional regulator C-terminal domain-containing protein [Streptomyces sp. NPDC047017]|uniref:TetR/AcrR family transcriptional regulator C-terminal domain-containing protein n=1 Tax=Streptomyces sp. NPDC047017 TaxID=3155024 RepID=UPI00340C9D3E